MCSDMNSHTREFSIKSFARTIISLSKNICATTKTSCRFIIFTVDSCSRLDPSKGKSTVTQKLDTAALMHNVMFIQQRYKAALYSKRASASLGIMIGRPGVISAPRYSDWRMCRTGHGTRLT